ncbi:RRP36 [Mytilus edulis]|uniref:rRNA biogenesis protein RRP36 n=1 Tax=Mytilus edulis TaxID=6550 RepID=A0A8S3RZ98_MYTED|nr:RRP36 [Mytilus edulis]
MSSTISVSKKRKSTLDTTASYSVNNAKKNKMSKLPKSPVDELHMMRKKEQVEESDTTSEESTVEEYEGSDTQEAEADELVTVKQELSNMSFEELIQLKERLGLKVYNQVVHGDKVKKPTSKRVFKRENKNRPMEMSSKRPVRLSKESDPAKKKMTRDPRFDDLSGEYNESYFKSNYSFLYDIKSREKEVDGHLINCKFLCPEKYKILYNF